VARQVQINPAQQGPLDAQNDRNREQMFALLQQIAPLPSGNAFPTVGVLGTGTYRGAIINNTCDVTGLNDPQVVGKVTLNASAIISGVHFREEIDVGAVATVGFYRCRFEKVINVAAGGAIAATACRFDGTSAILNAGVAADAGSTGCVKTSVTAHTNTTIVNEV